MSRFMVNGDGIVRGRQRCQIAGTYPVVHRGLDQPCDRAKSDLAGNERSHRDFVSRVVNGSRAAAGPQRVVSKAKSGKTIEIRRFESQLSDLGEIELRCRADDAIGPSEA